MSRYVLTAGRFFLTGVAIGTSACALAVPPSGLTTACGKAYESMAACRRKFAASDAPASAKQMFDQSYAKQMADAVQMWRAMRGIADIEKSCREIAANPECAD